ncbi:MAG: 50S ribosomal protein L15 [Bdellovibrionales bacterium]|nr:50S ribosomal protein L15 [Bdellovibrionales bacterium]
MSLLSELKPNEGSTHRKKRIGRGNSSGFGTTATRGHKGQRARKSGNVRAGYEGGQTPLQRRLPKFGFTNIFRVEFNVVNLSDLNKLEGEITPEILREKRLVRRDGPVKILARGEISKALKVKAHKFSATAKAAIEKAGGSVEELK